MSPLHHLLIAWLIANLIETDTRTRRLALIAGVIPDIDGVAVLFDQGMFVAYHHTFAHTLVFGIAVSVILASFVHRRMLGFIIIFGCFSAHLGADIIGTWGVPVFMPFISTSFSTSPYFSDNDVYATLYLGVLIVALSGAVAILFLKRRTPMEILSTKWDRIMVNFLILPIASRCHICKSRASFRCEGCARTVCGSHVTRQTKRILCAECESREYTGNPPSESN